MGYFLGQHNPSNYFALTEDVSDHNEVDFEEIEEELEESELICER